MDDAIALPRGGGPILHLGEDEDFHRLCERLEAELARMGPEVQGAAVTLDVGARLLSTRELLELEGIVSRYAGVRLVQIIDSSGGAARAEEPGAAGSGQPEPDGVPEVPARAPRGEAEARVGPPPAWAARAIGRAWGGPAELVRRTLRSGQRVVSSGHVVVLGDVNPGAEVVAGGDVVVLGTLRGTAHAGALGDERAVVAALRLEAGQVRIGRHIGRAPDGARAAGDGGRARPEVARVRDGGIVIESTRGEA